MKRLFLLVIGCLLFATVQAEEMKIITLGVMPTETVFKLKAEGRLIGVDRSAASFVEEGSDLQILNYHRTTSSEGILSLDPTHIIVTDAAGPAAAIEQIRNSGKQFLKVPEPRQWSEVLSGIRKLGQFISHEKEAEVLITKLQEQKATVDEHISKAQKEGAKLPRVLFVMSSGSSGNLLCAGADSGADAVIQLAGGVNAATGFQGYKPISAEALTQLQPDIILYPGHGGHALASFSQSLADHQGLKQSPASKKGRVHAVDLAATLGFGPSVGDSIMTLVGWFYPDPGKVVQ